MVRMARIEAAPRAVLAFYAALNRHDIAELMQHLADHCVFESAWPAPAGETYAGKRAVAAFWENFLRCWPQAHFEVGEVVGLGMRCVARWHCEWADPSGEGRHICGADLFTVANGLIAKHYSYVKVPAPPFALAASEPGDSPARTGN